MPRKPLFIMAGMLVAVLVALAISTPRAVSQNMPTLVLTDCSHTVSASTSGPGLDSASSCSPDGKHILFLSQNDLWVANADGSNPHRLTYDHGVKLSPVWSPDGTQIAFAISTTLRQSEAPAEHLTSVQIYLIGADGSNLHALELVRGTNWLDECYMGGCDTEAEKIRWSPDGKRLAYVANRAVNIIILDCSGNILTLPNFGDQSDFRWLSDEQLLVIDGKTTVVDMSTRPAPAMSTPSPLLTAVRTSAQPVDISTLTGKIAFWAQVSGFDTLYTMNADGSNLHPVLNTKQVAFSPSWSPDGKRIVFQSLDKVGNRLYVVNADGSNVSLLTNTQPVDSWAPAEYVPAWSPDGQHIAFASCQRSCQIDLIDPDGTNLHPINGADMVTGSAISWSPDSQQLVFASNKPGWTFARLYSVRTDGSDLHVLNGYCAYVSAPSWSPDSKHIAFRGGSFGFGPPGLFVMDTSSGVITNLADIDFSGGSIWYGGSVSWSPDSRYLVYDVNGSLYVVDAEGSPPVRLPSGSNWAANPAWGR